MKIALDWRFPSIHRREPGIDISAPSVSSDIRVNSRPFAVSTAWFRRSVGHLDRLAACFVYSEPRPPRQHAPR